MESKLLLIINRKFKLDSKWYTQLRPPGSVSPNKRSQRNIESSESISCFPHEICKLKSVNMSLDKWLSSVLKKPERRKMKKTKNTSISPNDQQSWIKCAKRSTFWKWDIIFSISNETFTEITNKIKLMENDWIEKGEELLIETSKRWDKNGFIVLDIILKAFYQLKEEVNKNQASFWKIAKELSDLKTHDEIEIK